MCCPVRRAPRVVVRIAVGADRAAINGALLHRNHARRCAAGELPWCGTFCPRCAGREMRGVRFVTARAPARTRWARFVAVRARAGSAPFPAPARR